jgi:hypothetical protein
MDENRIPAGASQQTSGVPEAKKPVCFLMRSKVCLRSLYSNSLFPRRSLLKAPLAFRTAGQQSLLSVSAENIARAETLLRPDSRETYALVQPRDFEPLIQQRNALDCSRCESNLEDVGDGASQIGMSPTRPPSTADDRSTVTGYVEDALAQHDVNPGRTVAFRTAGQQVMLSVTVDDMKRVEALLVSSARDTSELLQPSEFTTHRESSLSSVRTEARQIAVSAMTNCIEDDLLLAQNDSDASLSVAFRTAGRKLVSADAIHRAEAIILPDGSDASVLAQPINCKPHIQQCGSLECLRLSSNVHDASTRASRNATLSSKASSTIGFRAASRECVDDDFLQYDSSLSLGFRPVGQKSVLSVSADALDRAHALLLPDGRDTPALEQPSHSIPHSSPLECLRRASSDMVATGGSKIAVSSIRAPSIVGEETMTGSVGDDLTQQSLDQSPSLGFRTAGQKSVLSISADDIARATALLLPVGNDTPIVVRPKDDKPFVRPCGSLKCLRRDSNMEMFSMREDKVATESKMSHPNIDGTATVTTNNLGDDSQCDFDPPQASKTLHTPSAQYLPVFRGPFITPASSGYDALRRQLMEYSGRDCKFLLFHHSSIDISRLTP